MGLPDVTQRMVREVCADFEKEYLQIFIFVKNPFFAYIFLKFCSESRKIYKTVQNSFIFNATSVLKKYILMYGKPAMTCLNIKCTCTVIKLPLSP